MIAKWSPSPRPERTAPIGPRAAAPEDDDQGREPEDDRDREGHLPAVEVVNIPVAHARQPGQDDADDQVGEDGVPGP